MLAHNVYFSLKDTSAEAVDQMVRSCHTYLNGHPGVLFFAAGVLAEEFIRDANDRDFQVALHLVFTDKDAHDRYRDSEPHLKFIAENQENWTHARVFDSYVES